MAPNSCFVYSISHLISSEGVLEKSQLTVPAVSSQTLIGKKGLAGAESATFCTALSVFTNVTAPLPLPFLLPTQTLKLLHVLQPFSRADTRSLVYLHLLFPYETDFTLRSQPHNQPWRSATFPSTAARTSKRRAPSSPMSCDAAVRNSRSRFGSRSERRISQRDVVLVLEAMVRLAPRSALPPTVTMKARIPRVKYANCNSSDLG